MLASTGQDNKRGGEGRGGSNCSFVLLIKCVQIYIYLSKYSKQSKQRQLPQRRLALMSRFLLIYQHLTSAFSGKRGRKDLNVQVMRHNLLFSHSTSSHPSVGDCRPSNWSPRTARSGLHLQLESDKVPKWGHFQQLLFPALKPPTLKQHNKNSNENFCRGINDFPVATELDI